MKSWHVIGLALVVGGLSDPERLVAQRPSPLSGDWQIEFRSATSGSAATRGSLRLRDTLLTAQDSIAPLARGSAFVGTYHVDVRLMRAQPIGDEIRGQVNAQSQFWARLGEGSDRGEIELKGGVAGDSVSGTWLVL